MSNPLPRGTAVLEPIVTVMVWLEMRMHSKTMIIGVTEPGIETTYEAGRGTTHTVAYLGEKAGEASWQTVN